MTPWWAAAALIVVAVLAGVLHGWLIAWHVGRAARQHDRAARAVIEELARIRADLTVSTATARLRESAEQHRAAGWRRAAAAAVVVAAVAVARGGRR